MTLASPCRKLCTLDRATRVCTACGRSLDEIARWATMPDNERQAIMDRLSAGA